MGHPEKVSTPKESKKTPMKLMADFRAWVMAFLFDLFIHLYPRVLRGDAKPSGSCLKCMARGSFGHYCSQVTEGETKLRVVSGANITVLLDFILEAAMTQLHCKRNPLKILVIVVSVILIFLY